MTMPARPLVRIKRLSPLATVPAYQSEHAAGLDLHAAIDDPIVLGPGDIRLVPCGFAMAVPDGFEAQVRPRSGLASRHGISMPNAPGTIDADYRGEVQVPLINLSRQPFTIEPETAEEPWPKRRLRLTKEGEKLLARRRHWLSCAPPVGLAEF